MSNPKLPNRLTNLRLIMSGIIFVILLFPFNMIDINFKKYLVEGFVIVDTKMIIVGVLFILSCITDFLDGHLARKYNTTPQVLKELNNLTTNTLSIGQILKVPGIE